MNYSVIPIASILTFKELANAISSSLIELGHNSKVTTNLSDINIIIKAFREFNTNNNKINILFQTEELWNRRDKGIYDLSTNYHRVLEMFKINTEIPIGTKNVVHCPIGYSKEFETILPKVNEDIDVYFYGSLTDRRKKIIKELNILGETEIYGIERDKKIMKSKIIINIKAHDKWLFSQLHCLLAICKRKFILNEKCEGGYWPYIPNKHFIEYENIEDAKEKIQWWLSHDKEREEFAINAYNDIKKNIIFTNYIKKAMKGFI